MIIRHYTTSYYQRFITANKGPGPTVNSQHMKNYTY